MNKPLRIPLKIVCAPWVAQRAIWWDEEWHLRHAAPDLLDAGRDVVARWEQGDLSEVVRALALAVTKAEGGAP